MRCAHSHHVPRPGQAEGVLRSYVAAAAVSGIAGDGRGQPSPVEQRPITVVEAGPPSGAGDKYPAPVAQQQRGDAVGPAVGGSGPAHRRRRLESGGEADRRGPAASSVLREGADSGVGLWQGLRSVDSHAMPRACSCGVARRPGDGEDADLAGGVAGGHGEAGGGGGGCDVERCS